MFSLKPLSCIHHPCCHFRSHATDRSRQLCILTFHSLKYFGLLNPEKYDKQYKIKSDENRLYITNNLSYCIKNTEIAECEQKLENTSVAVIPITSATFSSCDIELWPIFLTSEYDLDSIMINHHAKYLGQRSLSSKVTI